MASGSKLAVGSAIAGNAIVSVAKLTAFGLTGSGAMLSEGIHSLADTMNQVLLLIGIRRAERKPDDDFAYGYRAERFVWALMSAVGIFFLGCGVTVYHGVQSLLHPHEPKSLGIAVGVLLFALVVEAFVLWLAYRELRKASGGKPFVRYLREEADPSAVAVLLEDTAACLGVLIALTAVGLTRWTGAAYWDAIGSIVIGLLLGGIAIWLIARNRHLLIGPAIPADDLAAIRRILDESATVERVNDIKSRVLDTETYRIKANVTFDGSEIAERLRAGLDDDWERITSADEFRAFADAHAERVTELLGGRIDALEQEIRAAVPKARFIDIEAD